jgi:hypothetical protein
MFAASKSGKVAAAAAATDPYFPYVPLLLETTTTNGQQNNTFLDSSSSALTITRNGTATQGSVTPYWTDGQWSNYFNGSTDWITAASSTDFAFGSGVDFTVECWVYLTAYSSGGIFGGGLVGTTNGGYTGWFINSGQDINTLRITSNASGGWADNISVSAGNGIPLNQWTHIAFIRNGGTLTLYKNGTSVGSLSGASTYNFTSPSNIAIIGKTLDGGGSTRYVPGYISNVRIVKGTAIVPPSGGPTAPFSTSTTNQVLLTCYSNRFIDSNTATTAKTIAIGGGTPKVQPIQPFSPTASYTTAAYGGSGYLNGSTDYVSAASSTAFAFGASVDFTVECWVYLTAYSSGGVLGGALVGTTFSAASGWFINSGQDIDTLRITSDASGSWGDNITVTAGNGLPLNQWTHIAFVRSGAVLTLYKNGNSVGSLSGASAYNFTSPGNTAYIGYAQSRYVPGYISNVRVVKGTAVYTGAFTPPTSPVTAITNTTFLANFTNAGIYDAAVQNNTITIGDAQASTTQYKWSPTSMKFDGTGDWLTAIDGLQLQLGTGDFTIDGWVYLSATGVAYGIISKGAAATGWSVNVTSGNKLQFSYTASNLTGATSLAATTWYYFAVVRSGTATGNLKVYLNGTADATSGGAVTDNFNQTSTLYVGASRTGATALNGYLQDVRITKGVARTITTPTAAFPTR